MRKPLLNKIFSCLLSYLIAITPFIPLSSPLSIVSGPLQSNSLTMGHGLRTIDYGRRTTDSRPLTTDNEQLTTSYLKMPMLFIENQGQMDEKVKFSLKGELNG